MFRSAVAVALLGAAALAAAAEGSAIATIVEGKPSVIRGLVRFDVVEGLHLSANDLVRTGEGAFVRIEYDDGAAVEIGPSTLAQINHPSVRKPGCSALYLLSGWMKLVNGKPDASHKDGICAPGIQVTDVSGTVVLLIDTETSALFVEDGKAQAIDRRRPGSKPFALKRGEYLAITPDHPPTLLERPVTAFVDAVPRLFRDTLPNRYAQFQGKPSAPQRNRGAFGYAEVEPWINAEAPVRSSFVAMWREKAAEPAFRDALDRDLKRHPEWDPILHPPPPPSEASAEAERPTAIPHSAPKGPEAANAPAPR